MEATHARPTIEAFFARVAAAPRRALLLDYDGTLAPFRAERDQATPYPGVPPLLEALIADRRTRVAIVSGRSIADLAELLALDPLPELWGSHGWERRLPGGQYVPPALSDDALKGLELAAMAAGASGLDHALERKPAGLALHWRGLDGRAARTLGEEIGQAWAPIVLRHGLQVHPFDGGLELRVPGRDKGTAVQTILEELAHDEPLAYLGDDLTDEDAFTRIGDRGLRVLVRAEHRPTAADVWIRPPEDLLEFLGRWAALAAPREHT